MKIRMISLVFFGGMFLLSACSVIQTPAMMPKGDKGTRIHSIEQFNHLLNNIENRKGQTIEVAGRLENVKETQDGYKVFASWLPYPSSGGLAEGPSGDQQGPVPNFIFYFPGKIQEIVFTTIHGDTFIMEGTIQGTEKNIVDMVGTEKNLLTLSADCVRIWETGTTSSTGMLSMDYPIVMARTFCSRK